MTKEILRRTILTLDCPDGIGIVAAVANFLAQRGLSIEDSDHFHDHADNRFYMRTEFSGPLDGPDLAALEADFAAIGAKFSMNWRAYDGAVRPKIVLAVSKFDHCLNDLLHRWKTGWLNADIVGIVSNHPDLEPLAQWHHVPFLYRPVNPATKADAEADFLGFMEELGGELLVLARYMQVLSAKTAQKLDGRCINIHHSFLPGFKGAKPYHQAHARGVKMIGATAHFVTADLDEGPIIEQGVERVSHRETPDDLIAIGRDVENTTLARAIQYYATRRTLRAGARVVVFR